MAIYGYVRVSTDKQTIENQINAITALGFVVEKFFDDSAVSGTTESLKRAGINNLISLLQTGDTVIATEVSRLGRDVIDVLGLVKVLKKMGVKLRIAALDGVDLMSTMGKLVLGVMAHCAEFERNLLIDRVNSGISRTRAQGTIFGASDKLSPEAISVIQQGDYTHKEYAEMYGVSTKTIQRAMKKSLSSFSEKYNMKSVQHLRNKEKK